ncbi:peptidylprolyl isomerase [bacterium]|nr:peptidylprolyl isomerase [bacterium]
MIISESKVVSLHYTLNNVDGEQIESSKGNDPLQYIQGVGQLIPGLEEALTGKAVGDALNVTVEPEKAYGYRSDDLIQKVSKEQFPPETVIEAGMQFQADNGMVFTVVEIAGEDVTLDANHDLAGQTLNFDVEVLDIREATAEELEHGHVHGPNGHED